MKRFSLLGLIFICYLNVVHAQKNQIRFEQIGINEGLSLSSVRCEFQDKQGFMWFGNKEGLYQYDGYKFNSYRKIPNNANSLSSNDVKKIVDDKEGNLWIATWDGGLNAFNIKNNSFKHYTTKAGQNSISSNFLETLYRDANNNIWIGTADAGLNMLNPWSGKFTIFKFDKNNPTSLSDNSVTAIDEDGDQNFWIGTKNGLNFFDAKSRTFKRYFHDANNANSLSSNNVMSLYNDGKGNLWIATYNGGINKLNLKTGQFTAYTTKNSKISSDALLSLTKGPDGNIWIGTDAGGLDILDPVKGTFQVFKNDYTDPSSISSNTIEAVYNDTKGDVWLGTLNGGICLIKRDIYNFTYYKHGVEPGSLSNNLVNCIFEDSKKRIWLGTDGGGVDLYNPATHSFTHFNDKNTGPNNSQKYICSINEDADGNIWFGSWGNGVTIYNSKLNSFKSIKHSPTSTNGLSNNYIFYIFKDSANKMWVGTYGGGVELYDTKNDKFINYQLNDVTHQSANSKNILTINEDRDHNILVGTDGAGLAVLNQNTNTFTWYNIDTKPGLSNNSVNSIYPDNKGNIWLGTNDGLDRLNINANRIQYYYKENGLPNNIITSILPDTHNNLWIGTDFGLAKMDVGNQSFKNFTKSDGLSSNEFKFSKCLARSGAMYFGTIAGFDEFFPDSIRTFQYDPPIVFTDFEIFYNHVDPDAQVKGKKILDYNISYAKELNLSYTQSVLTFEFASLNFVNRGKKQYYYILEGSDNKWHQLGFKNNLTYTNLDPGTYTLKVRGSDNNGEISKSYAELKINIFPPFWKTWWFESLFIFAFVSLVCLFFFWRVRNIKAHNKELELEVSKRTLELKKTNEILSATNEKIKIQNQELELANNDISIKSEEIISQQNQIIFQNSKLEDTVKQLEKSNTSKDKFFSILAHDLRNPISAIAGIARSLNEQISRLNKNEILKYINTINDSSKSVLDLLINLLEWAKTQNENLKPYLEDVSLYDIISTNQILMEQLMRDKNIFLTVEVSKQHFLYADKKMIETIIRNLFSNCIKFTHPYGQISIDSKETDNDIVITFHDTGMGMTEDQINNIINAELPTSSLGSNGEIGSGLGLVIVKEFIEANNGSIAIRSSLNEGTTFIISVPKANVSIPELSTGNVSKTVIYEDVHSEKLFDQKRAKLHGKRVLYVDDNTDMRVYLKLVLTDVFEYIEAQNGQEGMKAAIEFQPEIIITDMLMPVIDGLEFCKKLKENPLTSHIPVILLTSQVDITDQIDCYEAGADSYLTKPLNPKLLFQVIYNLVNSRENTRLKFTNSEEIYPDNYLYNARDKDFMEGIIEYIENNITQQNLDNKKLCETVSMSRTILYAKIKALTGLGVHEFIQSIRVKKGLQLLMIGRLNINQIAYEVGFNNPSYFSKCFTKQFGVPPKEYIVRLKNKNEVI